MIKPESWSPEWIETKVKEYDAPNYDLAEKMTYAFVLLEHIKQKGLDFIFKGGTSLVLMVDHFHRFSKDIDISVTEKPKNLFKIFDAIVADSPFTKWEQSIRKDDKLENVKEHYKFYYKLSKQSGFPEQPILLDILYVENTYPETRQVDLNHGFLNTEAPYVQITIPTLDSIAGDKLTAFAPATIGIPLGKNKEVEIAKQLFDLNLLFERITFHEVVRKSFEQTAAMCIDKFKMKFSVEQVYQDIIDTAFVIAMMGKVKPELHNEVKVGVRSLSNYLDKKANFGYNIAIAAAARIAYLASCLMKGIEPKKLNWKSVVPEEFKDKRIQHPEYGVLNKALKAGYPEAWYFWLHTVETLSLETDDNPNNNNSVKKSIR